VDGLLDTSILIDLWRGYPPAVDWADAHRDLDFGIHVLVRMELVEGAQNSADFAQVDRILMGYQIIYLTASDCAWAAEQHQQMRLSHGIGVLDTLIASSTMRLKLPLYTMNVKHFAPLPDVQAIRPY
jgi:hypothetical protein